MSGDEKGNERLNMVAGGDATKIEFVDLIHVATGKEMTILSLVQRLPRLGVAFDGHKEPDARLLGRYAVTKPHLKRFHAVLTRIIEHFDDENTGKPDGGGE